MLRENVLQKDEKFRSESKIFETCFFIFELNHLKKFLRAKKKCSFNKPPVYFPPEVERNVTQKAKLIKKNWNKIWKRLRKNTNCSLENPAKSFLSKFFCRKYSAKIQKPSLKFLKLSKSQSYWKKSVFSKNFALDTKS